jgi:NADH-quinone oxidoreductase subunit M
MLPDSTAQCVPWILWLSAAGIIYGALVALAQSDIKRLIAYSSVSHLGFCMLGIFALNPLGLQGGTLQMINHGLSTGGLFAVVGMIYERYHTRQIADLGGLTRRLPILAFFMLVFTFSSIGLPGLNGFAGEFLLLAGAFQLAWAGAPEALGSQLLWITVLAVLGVVLGAWYMLYLVQRVFFGPLREPAQHGSHGHTAHAPHAGGQKDNDSHGHGGSKPLPPGPADMNFREVLALAPLLVFIVWIGVYPKYFLDVIGPSVDPLGGPATNRMYQTYGPPQVHEAVKPLLYQHAETATGDDAGAPR